MHSSTALRRTAAILALVLATGGCRAAAGPQSGETVHAVASAQAIAITNGTRQPIYTFVVGRQAAALINWAPCVGGPSCPPLPPGQTRTVPSPPELTDAAEREALVYWWHAVRGPDGVVRPGRIRAEIVVL